MFLPRPVSFVDFRNTRSASGRRRAPLHAVHSSVLKIPTTPRPLQFGQAPYGELNEKRRGSISGNDEPSFGHMNFDDKIRVVPSGDSTLTSPFDSVRASSTASESRSRAFLGPSRNSLT